MLEGFSDIAQICVAVAVGYIAFQQYKLSSVQQRIDQERIKHELFDRRWEILEQAKQFIHPDWNETTIENFSTLISRAALLFPESSLSQLQIMKDIGNKYLLNIRRQYSHEKESKEDRLSRLNDDLVEKLSKHYGRFIKGVETLMKIEEYKV